MKILVPLLHLKVTFIFPLNPNSVICVITTLPFLAKKGSSPIDLTLAKPKTPSKSLRNPSMSSATPYLPFLIGLELRN